MTRDYEAIWVKGTGDGLARNLTLLLNRRAESGWRIVSVVAHEAINSGVLVVFEKELAK